MEFGSVQPSAVKTSISQVRSVEQRIEDPSHLIPELAKLQRLSIVPYDCAYHIDSYHDDIPGFESKYQGLMRQQNCERVLGSGRSGARKIGLVGWSDAMCPNKKDD